MGKARAVVVLFTRDLRVHDQPALAAAARDAEAVVPLFVLDDAILERPFARPNRLAFLHDALGDLDQSLRERGSRLHVRRGDVVREVAAVARATGARAVHASADGSDYAQRRERRLERALASERIELRLFDGTTVVAADEARTSAGKHFSVFTPFYRRWRQAARRAVLRAPRRLRTPIAIDAGRLPARGELVQGAPSPDLPPGGERAGRARMTWWIRSGLERYGELHDDLAADATSRLSPYLHFGCVSPLELADRVRKRRGSEPFVRQLCWRDFFHQLLAARPETSRADLRPRGDRWSDDGRVLEAWKAGRTGYPLVDAGMRQLLREGFMHNRARLVTASFLTKHLYVDWRHGARHFFDLLVDGDVANNVGNWQWVAGTGADARPNRMFNPVRQAHRFDPSGDYVRRYVPELADVEGSVVHKPWKLGIRPKGYPEPIVDHDDAVARFRAARASAC